MPILPFQRFGLRSMPDSRTVTNCFTACFPHSAEVRQNLAKAPARLRWMPSSNRSHASDEPEAVHPCRYRGPAAGSFAAVANAVAGTAISVGVSFVPSTGAQIVGTGRKEQLKLKRYSSQQTSSRRRDVIL